MNSTMLRSLAVAAALLGSIGLAQAAQIQTCAPIVNGGSASGRFVAPKSGTAYSRDARGCIRVVPADLGDAHAAGYVDDPKVLVGNQVIANTQIGNLPAGAYIDSITVQETSGGAVTGGIDIGTATGGQQIVAAGVCAANCLISVPDASVLKRVFSSTTPTAIWVQAHTNFNSGPAVNVTIHYSYF